jgi:hypothetical protein
VQLWLHVALASAWAVCDVVSGSVVTQDFRMLNLTVPPAQVCRSCCCVWHWRVRGLCNMSVGFGAHTTSLLGWLFMVMLPCDRDAWA